MIRGAPAVGIQYSGLPGISESCVDVVQRMIQYNDHVARATVLTCGNDHCIFLTVDEYDRVAIRSGFTSGYSGEGPRALARALQLLVERGADVEEVEVSRGVLDRVDSSSLTDRDIKRIETGKVVRPKRIYDYIFDGGGSTSALGHNWNRFPFVIPFSIIDRRLADLAMDFFVQPTDVLLRGFRRLEDTIRQRIESTASGAKLFSEAFTGEGAPLIWNDIQPSELAGRVNLFTGAYMAHRNPRAHRELCDEAGALLSEFLLLNHLFRLESEAIPMANFLGDK